MHDCVVTKKKLGNDFVSKAEYQKAMRYYHECVLYLKADMASYKTLEKVTGVSEQEKTTKDQILCEQELAKIFTNMSLCQLKLKKWEKADSYAQEAVELNPKNVKALYRRAIALKELSRVEEAITLLKKAHQIDKADTAIIQEMHSCAELNKEASVKAREEFRKNLNRK